MSNAINRYVFTGILLAVSNVALCKEPPEKCAEIAAPVDRLACFDKIYPPIVKGDTATVGFGLSTKKEDKPEPVRVEAKVATFSTMRDGKRLITLDNGQVWRETELKAMVIIKKDMPVVVREAALGTYMLVINGNVALRVKRVK